MTRTYRVLRKRYARTPFDGEGSYRYGGRWSGPGTQLTYTSEHQSLALLEYFIHLDQEDSPTDLVLAIAEVPDDLSRGIIHVSDLPDNWRDPAAPLELTTFGDEFVRAGRECLLIAPSVLAPAENTWLINPAHPEFLRIGIQEPQTMAFDTRMFRRPQRR